MRGFSLVEAMVATVIAVIAVLGLAHAFGTGRALINRYESARDALALAERQLEVFHWLPLTSDSLATLGAAERAFGPFPVMLNDRQPGTLAWTVAWADDPLDNLPDPDPRDYKTVRVVVRWNQGGNTDSVALARHFQAP